jgi:hypothetical protein
MPRLPEIDLNSGTILSPHVALLGAGASAAVCPRGDRNGKRLPLMNDLIRVVGLAELVSKSGYTLKPDGNFEDFYDLLAQSGEHVELLKELESRVCEYFAAIQISEEPTLYDYLLLGLRRKDLIATFNWDPLLVQAMQRNSSLGELPHVVFLHGNVAIGVCLEDRIKGPADSICSKCDKTFQPAKLLYPISQKGYDADPFIHAEWKTLESYISRAYLMLIFGYSAPRTDAQAKLIMQKAWDENQTQELAEIEIVDLKGRDEVHQLWADFIIRGHFGVFESLQQTWLFRHPRRTCEAFAAATLQNRPLPNNRFPNFQSLQGLQDWVKPMIAEEIAYQKNGTPFTARVPI